MSAQADLIPVTAASLHKDTALPGVARKRAGMDQALAAERAEWVERAVFLARSYVMSLPAGALFAIEDIRAYFAACEFKAPHHHNVYGSFPRMLMAAGLPMAPAHQWRKASSPATHAHPVALYIKTSQKEVI